MDLRRLRRIGLLAIVGAVALFGADGAVHPASATSEEPKPADANSIVGEWTGLCLDDDLVITLQVRGPNGPRLALTRIEQEVIAEVYDFDQIRFEGRYVRLGTASGPVSLVAELRRTWGSGSGHGRLTIAATNGRPRRVLQVEFFFLEGDSWMRKMIDLNRTATK